MGSIYIFCPVAKKDNLNQTADLLNAIVSINWITLFLGFF